MRRRKSDIGNVFFQGIRGRRVGLRCMGQVVTVLISQMRGRFSDPGSLLNS